jgi:hypothetical protein
VTSAFAELIPKAIKAVMLSGLALADGTKTVIAAQAHHRCEISKGTNHEP